MHVFLLVKAGLELRYEHLSPVGAIISNHKQVQWKPISWKSFNEKFLLNSEVSVVACYPAYEQNGSESKSKYSAFVM